MGGLLGRSAASRWRRLAVGEEVKAGGGGWAGCWAGRRRRDGGGWLSVKKLRQAVRRRRGGARVRMCVAGREGGGVGIFNI